MAEWETLSEAEQWARSLVGKEETNQAVLDRLLDFLCKDAITLSASPGLAI